MAASSRGQEQFLRAALMTQGSAYGSIGWSIETGADDGNPCGQGTVTGNA